MVGICAVLQISLFAIKCLHNRIIVNALESKSKESRESESNITFLQNTLVHSYVGGVVCVWYESQMNIHVEPVIWRYRMQAREWHFTPSKSFGSRSIKAVGLVRYSTVQFIFMISFLFSWGGGRLWGIGRFNKSNKFAMQRVFGCINQLLIDSAALSLMLKWRKIIARDRKGVNEGTVEGRNKARDGEGEGVEESAVRK